MGKIKDGLPDGHIDYATSLAEHLAIMTKLGDTMAEYMWDKEGQDYHDNCFEAGRDEFTIDVDDMWHIFQTILYWKYLSGFCIDPRYQFVKSDVLIVRDV